MASKQELLDEISMLDKSIETRVKALTQKLDASGKLEELQKDVAELNELLQLRVFKVALALRTDQNKTAE